VKWYRRCSAATQLFSNTVLENTDPEVLKNAYGTLIKTMTYARPRPRRAAGSLRQARADLPESSSGRSTRRSARSPTTCLLKQVVDAKRFEAERIKKGVRHSTKN
jgi:hypothetical protein